MSVNLFKNNNPRAVRRNSRQLRGANSLNPTSSTKSAFTIVELLIVIVVIGILAAISIVAYNGIQARASMTKKEVAISSAYKKLELHRVEYDIYPDTYDEDTDTFSLDSLIEAGAVSSGDGVEADPGDYSGNGSYDKGKVYLDSYQYSSDNFDISIAGFLYWDDLESEWVLLGKESMLHKTRPDAGTYESTDQISSSMTTSSSGQPLWDPGPDYPL